jgi:dephospho-CoA kinase
VKIKIGLTGGIGSGKTLVCQIFEKLGVAVYYADQAARTLMNTDEELKSGIKGMFGEETYGKEGLNRQYLAELVFVDGEKLAGLNTLVHPRVRKDFLKWTELQVKAPYVVEEAAILFESGAYAEMDQSVLVYAPEGLRIKRVMERDGVDREEVLLRMRHQYSEEKKMALADHILVNDGIRMLLPQVIELHNMILKRGK